MIPLAAMRARRGGRGTARAFFTAPPAAPAGAFRLSPAPAPAAAPGAASLPLSTAPKEGLHSSTFYST